MAVVARVIPVRLVAVFGNDELPEGAHEIGTLSLPVTVTKSTEPSPSGEAWLNVTPDVSVFQRLADFLSDESNSDPRQRVRVEAARESTLMRYGGR